MSEVKLVAFTCGIFQSRKNFFIESDGDEIIRSPVPAYLIEHPRGLALFDTGLGLHHRRPPDEKLTPESMGFDIEESDSIAARLRAMDIDPGAIRWIINSHLHADHCGGNGTIPNATMVVQSREMDAMRAAESERLYDPRDYDHGHPLLAISGEHDLHGDGSVVIFPTPGHTPGHQSVRVSLASGVVVLAADCCYLRRNLDEILVPQFNVDHAQSIETLTRLRKMRDDGARIFYGHDREFWQTVRQNVRLG